VSVLNNRYIRLEEMGAFLRACNYPNELIEDGIRKALSFNRHDLVYGGIHDTNNKNKMLKISDTIPYITTFNQNSNHTNLIQDALTCLQEKSSTKSIFKDKEILISKRQPANIKNILTRAKYDPNEIYGVHKCTDPRCKLCDIIITGTIFQFEKNIFNFKIKSYMTCNSLNCIYVMKCCGCSKTYIGETGNLRLRINLHRDHSNKNIGLGVSRHIFQCTANIDSVNKFLVMPFYKVHTDDINYSKNMESHFILKFGPELNSSP
jgi:hypothetical protein